MEFLKAVAPANLVRLGNITVAPAPVVARLDVFDHLACHRHGPWISRDYRSITPTVRIGVAFTAPRPRRGAGWEGGRTERDCGDDDVVIATR